MKLIKAATISTVCTAALLSSSMVSAFTPLECAKKRSITSSWISSTRTCSCPTGAYYGKPCVQISYLRPGGKSPSSLITDAASCTATLNGCLAVTAPGR